METSAVFQEANLGRLEKVELRKVWTHEASSFTPWLAKEDNLKLLGDSIGFDLVLQKQEQSVGLFRADLLCKDTGTDNWVLIENQIERTDHSHLGQLITYAAGLHAVTIVWIAATFTEEHRAALDWLNEVTGEEVSFFGIEVELWKIGDSIPAPKFSIVSKPNQFIKRATVERQSSSGNSKYVEYWQSFKDFAESRSVRIRPMKPGPQYWTNVSIGRTGFHLRAMASLRDRYVMADLVIYNDPDGQILNKLSGHRNELDILMPGASWNSKPGKKESAVEFRRNDFDPNVNDEWPEQFSWLLRALESLHEVFALPIRAVS